MAGDGAAGPSGLLRLAAAAGWPVLAEPSSGARQGGHALGAYQYLLEHPAFLAAHRPDLVICAGRPGLSRGQTAFLRQAAADGARQVILAQGPGRWADPARTATDVAAAVRLAGLPGGRPAGWLRDWREADEAAGGAVDAILDAGDELTEPRLARDLAAAMPDGALLWAASSLPIRDLDRHLAPRDGLRVLASRGASGIDGLISSAAGAALAHQASGGGPAAALLGDIAFLHDAPGLFAGPEEARPDLVLVVANNDGGGIFSALEQAAVPAPFERVFGTPHGARLAGLAAAAGIGHTLVARAADLPAALKGDGIRVVEVAADRAAGTTLRRRLAEAAAAAVSRSPLAAGTALPAVRNRAVPGSGTARRGGTGAKEKLRARAPSAVILFAVSAQKLRLCRMTGETVLMEKGVESIPRRPGMRHRERPGSGLIRVRLPSGHDSGRSHQACSPGG